MAGLHDTEGFLTEYAYPVRCIIDDMLYDIRNTRSTTHFHVLLKNRLRELGYPVVTLGLVRRRQGIPLKKAIVLEFEQGLEKYSRAFRLGKLFEFHESGKGNILEQTGSFGGIPLWTATRGDSDYLLEETQYQLLLNAMEKGTIAEADPDSEQEFENILDAILTLYPELLMWDVKE